MTALPESWRVAKLGDTLEVLIDHRGKTPAKLGGAFVEAGVPAISAIHVKDGAIDWSQRERYVTEEMYARWMPERLRTGDVLMTSEAPLGSLALVPSDAPLVLSQRLFGMRGDPSCLDNRYLRWFLESPVGREQLEARSSGSTVTGIRQAELRQLDVPLAPLAEQQRIAETLDDYLSRLDAADTYLSAAEQRADRMKWRAAELALANAGGAEVQLGEIASVRNGIFVSRPGMRPNGVPILRIGAIRPLSLDLGDLRYSERTESELGEADRLLVPGDILFTRYNGNPRFVGACAVVPPDAPALTYPDKLIRVRLVDDEVLPSFVALACSVGTSRATIQASVRTTAGQAGISGRDLKAVRLRLPDLDSQKAAVAAANDSGVAATRLASATIAARARSSALRRSLLTAAFSGRLTGESVDLPEIEERANA